MTTDVPLWIDVLTALLLVLGSLIALTGAIGILRLGSFFQRAHAPSLVATLGTWCFTLATALQVSFVAEQVFVHGLLIALFIAMTAPITTIFLMRAAMFRERLSGTKDWPEQGTP